MFFFFSSRRRHTRWTGDRSSDVCSSDLKQLNLAWIMYPDDHNDTLVKNWIVDKRAWIDGTVDVGRGSPGMTNLTVIRNRSEERRVGKESRSRWAGEHIRRKREKEEMVSK